MILDDFVAVGHDTKHLTVAVADVGFIAGYRLHPVRINGLLYHLPAQPGKAQRIYAILVSAIVCHSYP